MQNMQNWGKGVFLAILRNIGCNMMDKSRKNMKKDMYLAYLGSVYYPYWEISAWCVLKVLFGGWYLPQNTKWPSWADKNMVQLQKSTTK